MIAAVSWICLLAFLATPLVFPDAMVGKRFLGTVMLWFNADDGAHTPQWFYFVTVSAAGFSAAWAAGLLGRVRRSPLAAPLAGFAAVAAVLPFFAFRPAAAVWGSMKLIAGAGAVAVAVVWMGSARRFAAAVALLVAVNLAVAGYGVLQYVGLDPVGDAWSESYGGNRVFATLGNPNHLAGHLACLVPMAAAIFMAARGSFAQAGWFAITLVWAFLLLVAQTRGSWIACGVALAWLGYVQWRRNRAEVIARRGWLAALGMLAVLTGGVAALKNPDLALRMADTIPREFGQVAKRYAAMKAAMLVWREHPVFGIGPGCFKHGFGMHMAEAIPWPARTVPLDRMVSGLYEFLGGTPPGSEERQFIRTYSEKSAHNDWVELPAETGVAGVGAFVWLIVAALRALRAAPAHIRRAIVAGGIGLAVHAAGGFPLDIAPTMALLWVGVGIAGSPPGRLAGGARPAVRAAPGIAAAAGAIVLVAATLCAMVYAASVYRRAGTVFTQRGDWWNAHANYAKAARANWDDQREGFFVASMLFQLRRIPESIAEFEAEIVRNPFYMDGHTNMGSALGVAGRLEEAKARFRRAIELNPAYAEAYANLGVALLQENSHSEAAGAFRRALDLDPESDLARNGLHKAVVDSKVPL